MGGHDIGIANLADAVEIGRGGFGVVYRARDELIGREVAVKVLTAIGGELDPAGQRRFDRERRLLGRVGEHHHIVSIHSSGVTAHGLPYLVMPYLPGGSLAERIQAAGPLPPAEACRAGAAVASALAHAHELDVLHLDVKPANVLIDRFGGYQLADFGIAQLVGAGTAMITGSVSATPMFAAPEVLNLEPPSAAADVYSLGATVYAGLRGRGPYDLTPGAGPLVHLARVASTDPAPLDGGHDPALVELVMACLARPPGDRPTAAEAAARFSLLAGTATGGPVAGPTAQGTGGRDGPTRVPALAAAGAPADETVMPAPGGPPPAGPPLGGPPPAGPPLAGAAPAGPPAPGAPGAAAASPPPQAPPPAAPPGPPPQVPPDVAADPRETSAGPPGAAPLVGGGRVRRRWPVLLVAVVVLAGAGALAVLLRGSDGDLGTTAAPGTTSAPTATQGSAPSEPPPVADLGSIAGSWTTGPSFSVGCNATGAGVRSHLCEPGGLSLPFEVACDDGCEVALVPGSEEPWAPAPIDEPVPDHHVAVGAVPADSALELWDCTGAPIPTFYEAVLSVLVLDGVADIALVEVRLSSEAPPGVVVTGERAGTGAGVAPGTGAGCEPGIQFSTVAFDNVYRR